MPTKEMRVVKATAAPIRKLFADPKRTSHIEVDNTSDATIHEIDFSKTTGTKVKPSGKVIDAGEDPRPRSSTGRLLTDKQIRARARRRLAKLDATRQAILADDEFEWLYKPIEEWSLKELAAGRPLPEDGTIPPGPKPQWVTMEVHEKAMDLFVRAIKTEMNASTIDALTAMSLIINDNSVDHRGRPIVSASVKMDAAKFLLEHIVGKPKQHVTQDISIKLQGLMASVMVNPNEALAPGTYGGMTGSESDLAAYIPAHLPGHTVPVSGEEGVIEGEIVSAEEDPDWLDGDGEEYYDG